MEDFTHSRNVEHGYRYAPGREPPYENYGKFGNDSGKGRSLPRSISTADLQVTEQYQSVVARDYVSIAPEGGTTFFANTPMYTLALPVIENRELREFVLDLLRDSSVQKTLEKEHVINWCDSLTTLTPLKTISDGNCLLHAASLAMWGFQDRNLFLRRALNSAMESKTRNTLYDRWKQVREVENHTHGLILEHREWEDEWQAVKRQTRTDSVLGTNVDSLDDYHVFVLANVLRRPIIMYASPKIRSLASDGTLQKLYFSGVYLPLLWDPQVCKRSPLPLAYNNGHFSALTMMESPDQYNKRQLVLPLVDNDGSGLPVKFAVRLENPKNLLYEYLDITEVGISQSFSVLCSKLAVPDSSKTNNYTYMLAKAFVQACDDNFEMERGLSRERLGSGRRSNNRQQEVKPFTQNFHHPRPQEEDHSQQMRSKTTIQPRGKGTVKCSECSEPGLPQFLGRCERCHNRIQSKDEGSIYEPIPSPMMKRGEGRGGEEGIAAPALPIPRDQSQRSQCRTPGCDFFGTKEFRFYCSKCFDANMEKILKEVDDGPPPAPTPAPANPVYGIARETEEYSRTSSSDSKEPGKCRVCRDFFGSKELNDLCNKCFLKSTEKQQVKTPVDPFQLRDEHQGPPRREKFDEDPKYGRREAGNLDYSNPVPMKKKQGSSGDLYQSSTQVEKMKPQAEACVLCRGINISDTDSEAFIFCRRHAIQLVRGLEGRSEGDQRRADDLSRRTSAGMRPLNEVGGNYSATQDRFLYTQPDRNTGRSGHDNEYSSNASHRPIPKMDSTYDFPSSRPRGQSDYSAFVQGNNSQQGLDDARSRHRSVDNTAVTAGMGRGYHGGGLDGHGHNILGDEQYRGTGGTRREAWEQPPLGDIGGRGRRYDDINPGWNSNKLGPGKSDSRMGIGDPPGYRVSVDDRVPRNSAGDRGYGFNADDRGHRLGDEDRGFRNDPGDRGYGVGTDDRSRSHGGGDDSRYGANGRGGNKDMGTGGAGGVDPPPPSDGKLCAEIGCSFYAHRQLENRCPSCYEQIFKKPVDRDIFPEE